MSRYTTETSRYDRLRVSAILAIDAAIDALRLPMHRERKISGIVNALEIQVEDGGDDPEVNALLVAAVRRAAEHQVGKLRAAPLNQALDAFERLEEERWELIRRGLPPPRSPVDRLDELTEVGVAQSQNGDPFVACEYLAAAWELVKELREPDIRSGEEFTEAHDPADCVVDWFEDWLFALEIAGGTEPRFLEQRARAIREYSEHFPDDRTVWGEIEVAAPPVAPVRPAATPARRPGRNDPCWCGSGRKYKRCHLGSEPH